MAVASAQTLNFGINPSVLDVAGVLGDGRLIPQFKVGTVTTGEDGAEWIYCKYVLGSTTDLLNGQWFAIDKDFTATLLPNAATGNRGVNVGVSNIQSLQNVAGTYYLWLQRAGQCAVKNGAATGTLASAQYETDTTVAGTARAPASATTGNRTIQGAYPGAINQTFTADIVNGNTLITNVGSGFRDTGPFVGATLSGTGIAASQTIASINYADGTTHAKIVSIVLSAAASATNTGVTVTATGVLEANLAWPIVDKTN